MADSPDTLVILAKSTWAPSIRREHAIARQATKRGYRVVFLERPSDARVVRQEGRRWLRDLCVPTLAEPRGDACPADVYSRSVVVPGHLNRFAGAMNARLTHRHLRAIRTAPATTVVGLPWDWEASRGIGNQRRVFDLADDWSRLMPGRERWLSEIYRRIAAEADEIVVVAESMLGEFPGRTPALIKNGVEPDLLREPPASEPRLRTMLYVGTLSPRLDHALLEQVLKLLPDWTLDLYGPCLYPGCGDQPSPELLAFLDRMKGRVALRGVVARSDLASVLDRADVLVLPNVPSRSVGQDSMKLYDYAARGRPIVSTPWAPWLDRGEGPPVMRVCSAADEFAFAVTESSGALRLDAQISWAKRQTWEHRWPPLEKAFFGREQG